MSLIGMRAHYARAALIQTAACPHPNFRAEPGRYASALRYARL